MGAPVSARRRLPRRDPPVAARPQGAHVRADRRDRRRPDHVAARAHRRRAQLGLPLLLAPRRDADAARDARGRLQRRGGGLARLAAPRGRGRPGRPADHVRHRRRAAPRRARARLAPGLRGLAARCASATPPRSSSSSTSTARCSTRSTRRARTASRPTTTPGRSPRKLLDVARGRLAAARRRHLGGARPAPALHALEGDGVGRVRPRGPDGRGVRARAAASTAGAQLRDEIHAEVCERGLVRAKQAFTQSYGSRRARRERRC